MLFPTYRTQPMPRANSIPWTMSWRRSFMLRVVYWLSHTVVRHAKDRCRQQLRDLLYRVAHAEKASVWNPCHREIRLVEYCAQSILCRTVAVAVAPCVGAAVDHPAAC